MTDPINWQAALDDWANTDTFPTDTELLELDGATEAKAVSTSLSMLSAEDEDSVPSSSQDPRPPGGGDTPGVATQDGKGVLDYEVLKSARTSEAAARRELDEALNRIRTLETQITSASTTEDPKAQDQAQESKDELLGQLDQLAEDFPELAGVFKTLHTNVTALQTKVGTLEGRAVSEMQEEQEAVAQAIRAAIDNNPLLSLWEASDPEAWGRAHQFDDLLKNRKEWAGKPFAERFEQVAKMVLLDYPQAKRPTTASGGVLPTGGKENAVSTSLSMMSVEDLSRKADQALDEAGEFQPRTLSDIPGGTPPSDKDRSNLSVTQLEGMFENWTDDQITAYLAKAG
jgi:hypothetical protein